MESTKKAKTYSPKVKFTPEEDARLCKAVREFGTFHWKIVAKMMDGRNARQCRERWSNYLSPDVEQNDWTPEEESLLETKYAIIGPKWHILAALFKKRSTNQIKNRWAVIQRRKMKEEKKAKKITKSANLPVAIRKEEKPVKVVVDKGVKGIEEEKSQKSRTEALSFLDSLISSTTVSWVPDGNINGVNEDFFSQYIF